MEVAGATVRNLSRHAGEVLGKKEVAHQSLGSFAMFCLQKSSTLFATKAYF